MRVVSMSEKEFSRLDILLRVEAGCIAIRDACALMGLRRRQVFRLQALFRVRGVASLASKRRGRPSNNQLPTAFGSCPRRSSGNVMPISGPPFAPENRKYGPGAITL
jgi:Winged helix-turn helix